MPKAMRARTMKRTMMMIAMTSFSLTIVATYVGQLAVEARNAGGRFRGCASETR